MLKFVIRQEGENNDVPNKIRRFCGQWTPRAGTRFRFQAGTAWPFRPTWREATGASDPAADGRE